MWVVHAFRRQFFHDRDAFRRPSKHVERISVSHRDVHVARRAIVGFFREVMAVRWILINQQGEPRTICGERRFVRRILVEPLRNLVETR